MSEAKGDWTSARTAAAGSVERLLGPAGSAADREAVIRFLAGRDGRPWTGAFAALSAPPPRTGPVKE